MAIYKGREVQVQALPRNSYEPQENIQITDKDGQTYNVKLFDVQFTEDEKKNLQVETGKRYENVRVVSDKDLKELKDSQDTKKIVEKNPGLKRPEDSELAANDISAPIMPVKDQFGPEKVDAKSSKAK